MIVLKLIFRALIERTSLDKLKEKTVNKKEPVKP